MNPPPPSGGGRRVGYPEARGGRPGAKPPRRAGFYRFRGLRTCPGAPDGFGVPPTIPPGGRPDVRPAAPSALGAKRGRPRGWPPGRGEGREAPSGRDEVLTRERSFLRPPRPPAPRRAARPPPAPPRETGITVRRDERRQCGAGRRFGEAARLGGNAPLRREKETPSAGPEASASRATCEQARCEPVMILPQVHLRKPCYDFYFL